MIGKILIANRGEIAIRIMRSCREMNIRTVAVFSEADRTSKHVFYADEAYCIGGAASSESYLNIDRILETARQCGADAIHPGYGFLSENAEFARRCQEAGIIFIGPRPETIKTMGDKISARQKMIDAGVPVVPGTRENLESVEDAREVCRKVGFPVMIKASQGGGGKGIRIVQKEEELENAYNIIKQEAKAAFNDDEIYMEKYIENPRHVEIQVLADEHDNSIYLGERDCSIQRRNQKILEESPSSILTSELRTKMGKAALKAVKASKYTNARNS